MDHAILFRPLFALTLIALGYIPIRAFGLNLPTPKNFSDFICSFFWIYPASVTREKIVANKIAWFVVCVVSYLITISVF